MEILNYIDGRLVPPITENWLDNIEPATGKVYGRIPASGPADVSAAYDAARKAFPVWSTMTREQRSAIMLRIADRIDAMQEELAQAESRDNGKLTKVSRTVDIPRASSNMRFFGTAILHFASESHDMDGMAINYTLRQPIGVVGCISPWNLPLYLFTWKIAPALAAGNTVVAKPSEVTPATAFLLSQICIDCGMPAGVLNIVHGMGPEVGQAIVEHPGIKAISFTGGTATGAAIARIAAPMFKKLSLELGGKNPAIVFADCDLESTLRTLLWSSFANQGQICLCGSRILIERSIYAQFRDRFVEEVKRFRVSFPTDEAAQMAAIVSESHLEKILGYVELAKQEGGTVLAGGNRIIQEAPYNEGFYMQPTVIEGLGMNCRTNQEEIFGPVVTLTPFDSEEEAVALANSTPYGLAASVWTSHVQRANRVAAVLETGIVWINCWLVRDLRTPFGGVKQSGVGREGGWEALRFFTEPKNVCVKL
jgi:aminomuconate-semialdehyde/2-hydroxymuconate-6-semialdehyde dehydrogenase